MTTVRISVPRVVKVSRLLRGRERVVGSEREKKNRVSGCLL